jgi:hypothetical protein
LLSHLRSYERYDEPETLPYSIRPFCPMSADAGQTADDAVGATQFPDIRQMPFGCHDPGTPSSRAGGCRGFIGQPVERSQRQVRRRRLRRVPSGVPPSSPAVASPPAIGFGVPHHDRGDHTRGSCPMCPLLAPAPSRQRRLEQAIRNLATLIDERISAVWR